MKERSRCHLEIREESNKGDFNCVEAASASIGNGHGTRSIGWNIGWALLTLVSDHDQAFAALDAAREVVQEHQEDAARGRRKCN